MITITNVTKRFSRRAAPALADVSLTINRGESVALWGANGAGKTTLIRCILGLHRFRGTITVDGHDARRAGKQARKLIGYVPQELGFYDDLRVHEAIAYFAKLKNVAGAGVDAAATLDTVGLLGHETKRIRELSGGMKQRLALGIALLGDPPILVLDEVTASLDACGREAFIALLKSLASERGGGRSLLFASHRIDEVTTLADRVVTLEKGRITGQVASHQFAPYTASESVLHLHIAAPVRTHAIGLLKQSGFDAQLNGVGLLVPVPAMHKAAPFRILADHRIAIDDFEVLGVHTLNHTHTSTREGARS